MIIQEQAAIPQLAISLEMAFLNQQHQMTWISSSGKNHILDLGYRHIGDNQEPLLLNTATPDDDVTYLNRFRETHKAAKEVSAIIAKNGGIPWGWY